MSDHGHVLFRGMTFGCRKSLHAHKPGCQRCTWLPAHSFRLTAEHRLAGTEPVCKKIKAL
jgi:hypothetical protein